MLKLCFMQFLPTMAGIDSHSVRKTEIRSKGLTILLNELIKVKLQCISIFVYYVG